MKFSAFSRMVVSALFMWTLSTPSFSQESISGSVSAANRSFQQVISGPRSRVYAGVVLTVRVTGGQADINYRHRERRKCKWYGKCWYERWIDHFFKSPNGEMWPIQYQLVDENGTIIEDTVQVSSETNVTIEAPIKPTEFNKSFRLQAKFADKDNEVIDPNRTNGVFELNVSFDTSSRIDAFPDFLSNGAFLPLSREIRPMIELDVWTRENGKSAISRALVNYARVSFPSEDSLKKEEHFSLLEIAQSLDPESDSVSRALVDHYVATGNFSGASAEIKAKLEGRERELDSDPNNRVLRLALAKDYAYLAALVEREGTLLTPQEYGKVDSYFDRAVRHANRANSRDLMARILAARASILRKSNTPEGLAKAAKAQTEAVGLLGRAVNANIVSLSPDNRFMLVTKSPASTGMITQPAEQVANDRMIQEVRLEHPDMITKREVKPLFVSTSGDVIIDDGGILSEMHLREGKFDVEPIDNVTFEAAQRFRDGIFGLSKSTEEFRFSVLSRGRELESIPFGDPSDLTRIPIVAADQNEERAQIQQLPKLFGFSVSENSNLALIIGKQKNPFKRLFEINDTQLEPVDIGDTKWDLRNATVHQFKVSPAGTHVAAFLTRTPPKPAEDQPQPPDQLFVEIIRLADGEVKQFGADKFPEQFIDNITGLTFSQHGRHVAVLSHIDILRIGVESGRVGRSLPIDASEEPIEPIPRLFGLDNEGALIAAAINKESEFGIVFRLQYDAARNDFESDPKRIKVSNRVLESPGLLILANGDSVNLGIPRHTSGDFSVIDLSTGSVSETSRRAVHFENAKLLSGGRFIVSIDDLSNSVVLFDLIENKELPLISPVVDLGDQAKNDGITLRPVLFPLEKRDQWALVWLDRQDSSVKFISKFEANEKLDTLVLDSEMLEPLSDRIEEILAQDTIQALGLPEQPPAKFVLSIADTEAVGERIGGRTPIITVEHALSQFPNLDVLRALPDPLNRPITSKVVDLNRDELTAEDVQATQHGMVIAFDLQARSVLLNYAGQHFLRDSNGAEVPFVFPPNEGEQPPRMVFVPKFTADGNLSGSSFVFLFSQPDGMRRISYMLVNETSSGIESCSFCTGKPFDPNVLREVDDKPISTSALVSLVGTSHSLYGLPEDNAIMLYPRNTGRFPVDELPLARIGLISKESKYLLFSKDGSPSLYNPPIHIRGD